MKKMKLSEKEINKLMVGIKDLIRNTKTSDGKVSFSAVIPPPVKPKAQVIISGVAYEKIRALVTTQEKEIGWHGTVTKTVNGNVATYKIEDIIVFPQTVTASTVVSDQSKYGMWLYSPEVRPLFNSLRFHGHSHVNMGVTPSGVDIKYQSDMIETLQDFYIFGIFNKRDQNWMQIFDVEDNVIYEDSDIDLTIEHNVFDWAKEMADQYAKAFSYTPPTTSNLTAASTQTEKWGQSIMNVGNTEAKATLAGKSVQQGRKRTLEEEKKHNDDMLKQEALAELKKLDDDYERAYTYYDRREY